MASEVQQLREQIEFHLRSKSKVSLVEVLAAFDCRNHSLPSAWRWRRAIEELSIPVTLSSDELHLNVSAQNDIARLSDEQVAHIVETYRKSLLARRPSREA